MNPKATKVYDLIVLGAGTGNAVPGPELAHLRTAIVEPDRFGGTCLNRGCIPSKMLVVTADTALSVTRSRRLGVHATLEGVDWPAVRDPTPTLPRAGTGSRPSPGPTGRWRCWSATWSVTGWRPARRWDSSAQC